MWYKIGRSSNIKQRIKRHKACGLTLDSTFLVRDAEKVESLIHTELKGSPDVVAGLPKCSSCGIGHREFYAVVHRDSDIVFEVVRRYVEWDNWVYKQLQT